MTNTAIARERAIEDDKPPLREPSKTPLGKELREIRERIVASGTPLLNDEELAAERLERRGDDDTNAH